jgi:hypothetical protein
MAEKRHHDLKTVKGRSREHLRTISSEVRKEKRGETAKRFRGISADETQQIGELQSDPSAVLQSAAHSVRVSLSSNEYVLIHQPLNSERTLFAEFCRFMYNQSCYAKNSTRFKSA